MKIGNPLKISEIFGGRMVLWLLALGVSSSQLLGQSCPYGGGGSTVIATMNGTDYTWLDGVDYFGNRIQSSPGSNPVLTPCGSVYVTGSGYVCVDNNETSGPLSYTDSAGCTVATNLDWTGTNIIGFTFSNPTNDTGQIIVQYPVRGECDVEGSVYFNAIATIEVKADCGCGGGGGGGGGGGSGGGAPGSTAYAVNSADFRLNLGAASMFQDGGFIWMHEVTNSAALSTPAVLKVPFNRPNVEVYTNGGVIKQVKTPLILVNILDLGPYRYQLQIFSSNNVTGTNAPYGTNAAAFETIEIQNPDTNSANNRLWFTEKRTGLSDRVFQFTYSNTSTQLQRWDLLLADGVTVMSKWTTTNAANSSFSTNYWQTRSGTNILSQKTATYQFISAIGRSVIIAQSEGVGAETQTTTNTYYSTPLANMNNLLLQRVDYPDGRWVYYVYDDLGRVTTEYSAFNNNPPPAIGVEPNPSTDFCKVTAYYYDDDSSEPSRTTVSIPVEIYGYWTSVAVSTSRRYRSGTFVKTQEDVVPDSGWNYPGSLQTYTYYHDVIGDPATDGRVWSVSHSDGTASYYEYSLTNDVFTTVVSTGEPDDWFYPTSITNGTQITTTVDGLGRLLSKVSSNIVDGVSTTLLQKETYVYSTNDPLGRDYIVYDLANRTNQFEYACCGLSSIVDPNGVVTMYDYDSLRRQSSRTVLSGTNAVTYTNTFDGAGRMLTSKRIGSDSTYVWLDRYQYDSLGRVVAETNALNGVTRRAYAIIDHQQFVTNTYPDGGTRIEQYYRDGKLQSTSGTAVFPVQYQYGADFGLDDGISREYTVEIKSDLSGNTNEWTKTITDAAGRHFKTVYSGETSNPFSVSYYDQDIPGGQLTNRVDADGVSTLFVYNSKGERTMTVTDMNRDYNIDFDGEDRITMVTNDVVYAHGTNVRRTQTYVWSTNNSDTSTLISTSETSVNGLDSWQTLWNNGTAVVRESHTVYAPSQGLRVVTNIAPDLSYSVTSNQYGRLISVTQKDSTNGQLSSVSYAYDAHGRQSSVTDARNGTTTYEYNPYADLVEWVTTPAPGAGLSPQSTVTYYNKMLQATNVLNPDGTSVTTEYFLTGQLKKTYGSRTYPVEYTYDYAGRMQTMKTWTNYASNLGAALTTWNYDLYRGWLTNKQYADNHGTIYSNTPAGRLAYRLWARGTSTDYGYNAAGDLQSIVYSDGVTPNVTNTYDRRGRLAQVAWTNITQSLAYNDANELLRESWSGGVLNGLAVTNAYDAYLRRSAVGLSNQVSTLTQFGYDAASRLSAVTNGSYTAGYSYVANSPLVSQIQFQQSGTTRMTTVKTYDYLNRLTEIDSRPTAASAVNFGYSYNDVNQRTRRSEVDGSYWVYQYDTLGQVTSGKKYWADGTLVAGQQFEYGFDDIGNRQTTKSGGDATGANLRSASYTANSVNQYTSRTVPGYIDVKGISFATNAVTVNSLGAERHGEYYRKELTANNSGTPVWTNITVTATGQSSQSGNVLLEPTPETFTYDLDGNLTSDGLWTNTWNAENRLLATESRTNVPTAARIREVWSYLPDGRWSERVVSTNNGSSWIAQSTNRFVWDGKVLLAVLDHTNGLVMSFMRGTDLSGTMQGAGGVGGVLAVNIKTNGTHFYAYDGNGNVAALVTATNGTVSANYEYGPFGEVIRITGSAAKANPIRFSTQYADDNTSHLKYLYRDYDPSTGRWLSRDPIGEEGGPNIYEFVYNAPANFVDLWGLECQNIFNFGVGGSWNVATGIFAAWDFDVNVDKCDRWSSPATIEGCDYCYRVHVKAGAEIGVGAKFYWKRSASVLGFGFQAALSAEFSLAKVGANGETTVFICPNPLGTVVDHDSSVVRLVDLTVGPTASVSASGGAHAGKYVNINVVGDITAYASLHATLGVKVVSYGRSGNIQAVGSLTGNMGFNSKLYARGNVFGGYFDWNFWDFNWTLFDKPGWADEEELGRLWSW